MTDQPQWEYCEVGLGEWKHHKTGFGNKQGWSYECYIRYYATEGNGEIFRKFADINHPLTYNPFTKAIAQLGAGGWELVSIEHGRVHGVEGGGGFIRWDNRVAYFKRPMVAGRPINEPKLAL